MISNLNESEESTLYPKYFFRAIYDGKNEFYQKEKIESKKFDDTWIKTVESYFPVINKITKNLKSSLKYQSEIIPIEKTKKINKESVIHLMSHSNFISEITDEGVIPKQVLTILPEIEYGIYENRFIMTLINKLCDFINRRVKLMKKEIRASKITHMNLNSTFTFEESDIEMTVDLKQTEAIAQQRVDAENKIILERAEKLLRLVSRLKNGHFMKVMKRFKEVTPPILKTQIILSNVDFKNSYLLWMYLDRYNELGYEYDLKTVNKRFTDIYTKRIHQSLMVMCSTLFVNNKSATLDSKKIDTVGDYKPKRAKTILKLPSDIDPEPVAFEITDVGLNEYFLAKNRRILKKQLNELTEEGCDYKVALKVAMAQTMSITNGLYESFFEYNADTDVFKQLIKEDDDPQQMYESAYQKYIIACSVREMKEQDFKRALALEKKWQKQLKRLHKMRMISVEGTVEKKFEDLLDEIRNKYKERLDVCVSRNYTQKAQLMRKHRLQLYALRKSLREEYDEKKTLLTEKAERYYTGEKAVIISKAKFNKQQEEEKYKNTMDKLRFEHKEKMTNLDEKYKEMYTRNKDRITKEANDKIERLRIRNERYAEQRRIRLEKQIEKHRIHLELVQKRKQERQKKAMEERLERHKKVLEERAKKI